MKSNVGVRWTIGDVSDRGFDALRLSVQGVTGLLPDAAFVICVNNLDVDEARRRAGKLPAAVQWRHTSKDEIPAFLRERFDSDMAEGVGWKLAPLRVFPDCWELALDNDCVLWELPEAIRSWLECQDSGRCVFAADVRPSNGQFQALCGQALNSGIRGLPPGFDYEAALRQTLADADAALGGRVILQSELDEQGLQAAAVVRHGRPLVVTTDDVSICSPFWPHQPGPGRCGAHFVGLNARHLPFDYYDRPATLVRAEHYDRLRDKIAARVGQVPSPGTPGEG